MEEAHIYERKKYLELTKQLADDGYKAVLMTAEVGARGFIGSSVYDLLTIFSICDNKRTKALKPKTFPARSGAGEMRSCFI